MKLAIEKSLGLKKFTGVLDRRWSARFSAEKFQSATSFFEGSFEEIVATTC
jgi:hypothetical protein